MVRNSNLNWDEMLGSNTSYDSNQYSILISWNSRHVANFIFSVFVYYNLAIKHTVNNSVIWSGADVLMLVYFLFYAFQAEWKSIHYIWILAICVLDSLKKLQQELPKNMLLSFSNKFFFHKFIYKSILSMILLKMYKWYWVLFIQKENFLWWNISSLHCK